MRIWWLLPAFSIGCVTAPGPSGPGAPKSPPPVIPPDAGVPPPPVAEDEEPVYPLDEALADVFSSPLTHFGTGKWHGIARIHACAYRNARVIVVNVYCTRKEQRAFRIDVFSPTRGRVRIYAEAESAISPLTRAQYFTFQADSEPKAPPEVGLPPFSLTMSFAELQVYERKRYEAFLPVCFGGMELRKPQGGCLRDLESHAPEFAARNRAFLEQPPAGWYRLIKDLRGLAAAHGK